MSSSTGTPLQTGTGGSKANDWPDLVRSPGGTVVTGATEGGRPIPPGLVTQPVPQLPRELGSLDL